MNRQARQDRQEEQEIDRINRINKNKSESAQMARWTAERVSALKTEEISTLAANAVSRGNEEVVNLCQQELAKRMSPREKRLYRGLASFEKRIAHQMGVYAHQLAREFDLSEATARKHGGRTHKLTDRSGNAKAGGAMKGGTVDLDRYLSYRLGGTQAWICVYLAKDAPLEHVRFQVGGTPDILPDGQPYSEARPEENPSEEHSSRIKEYPSLEEALDAYRKILGKFALRLNA